MPEFCLECEHFYVAEGWRGYSEYTPGSDQAIFCLKNHWCNDWEDGTAAFRENLRKAVNCKDFEQAAFLKSDGDAKVDDEAALVAQADSTSLNPA